MFERLGVERPADGKPIVVAGHRFVLSGEILRSARLAEHSASQRQTGDTFGFKWQKRDTFESEASLARLRSWLVERYGDVQAAAWWDGLGPEPLLLDVGCGAAMSALELFGARLKQVRYLGVDFSEAVDVAAERFRDRGLTGAFLQADLREIPLAPRSVQVIFSEGVLHHTDSTRESLLRVADLLAPGGVFLFYVYRKKGPIREFTDDYLRERLRNLPPEEAWKQLEPLTRLGQTLGELGVDVEIPEPIEILDIPAGRIPLQRLFYWHVFKAFYGPDLSFDELNHINFDWYAPAFAHRQTPEEVREWCQEAGLVIEREVAELAGITVVARRPA